MLTLLLTSTIVLWVVVIFLVLAVVVLTRQLGIIYERIAPMGALIVDQGPETGRAAPQLDLEALDGARLQVGGSRAKAQLIFIVSPTCPVCKKMVPILRSTAAAERSWLDVLVSSDGDDTEIRRFHSTLALGDIPFAISSTLGRTFRVNRLPYALLIDREGVLRAKGLINTREHLESLFTAMHLGVESVQQFVRGSESVPQNQGEPAPHVNG